jgi:hypothetical protein
MFPPLVIIAAEEKMPVRLTGQDHLLHPCAQCIFFHFVPLAIRSLQV